MKKLTAMGKILIWGAFGLAYLLSGVARAADALDTAIGELASPDVKVQERAVDRLGKVESATDRLRAAKALLNLLRIRPLKREFLLLRKKTIGALAKVGKGNPDVVRAVFKEGRNPHRFAAGEKAWVVQLGIFVPENLPVLREFAASGTPFQQMELLSYIAPLVAKPTEEEKQLLGELLHSPYADSELTRLFADIASAWKTELRSLAPAIREATLYVLEAPKTEGMQLQDLVRGLFGDQSDSRAEKIAQLSRALAFAAPGTETLTFFREELRPAMRAAGMNQPSLALLAGPISIAQEGKELRHPEMEAWTWIDTLLKRLRAERYQGLGTSDFVKKASAISERMLLLTPQERADFFSELAGDAQKHKRAALFLLALIRHIDRNRPQHDSTLAALILNPYCKDMLRELRLDDNV